MTLKATRFVTIDSLHVGQRLDNFLFSQFKGVPKSRIYRALRKGEVRVNKKRKEASYRLEMEDAVRLPPLHCNEAAPLTMPSKNLTQLLTQNIIYENDQWLVLNKPAGIAVHRGSEIELGVIEALRQIRSELRYLELCHRLDRATSGCLLLSKDPEMRKNFQQLLLQRQVTKTYLLLVKGQWQGKSKRVEAPLKKNLLQGGERMVKVAEDGKPAATTFRPLYCFPKATLLAAELHTGRTHQIRVHAAHIGHPVAGDEKYGDSLFNRQLAVRVGKRLFLHSASLSFTLPFQAEIFGLCACLDPLWRLVLQEEFWVAFKEN